MLRINCSALLIVLSSYVVAQNLVPNPSFEEYLECPYSLAALQNELIDWYSWGWSPDFFHVCSNDIDGFAGVSENALGYQLPITGDGYAGFGSYEDINPNTREYVAAPLLSELIPGEDYYMMFHVSMIDGGAIDFRWCATNNLGMRFFKDPQHNADVPITWLQPDNFAHLNYDQVLDDYTNWTLVEGWFTADDNYNWVAIGNFFTDDQTEVVLLTDTGQCTSIYYLENVCVARNSEECDYLLNVANAPQSIQVGLAPNPASEFIRLMLPQNEVFRVELIDMHGRIVKNVQGAHSGEIINVSALRKGVYVVRVSNNQSFTTLKLLIQ